MENYSPPFFHYSSSTPSSASPAYMAAMNPDNPELYQIPNKLATTSNGVLGMMLSTAEAAPTSDATNTIFIRNDQTEVKSSGKKKADKKIRKPRFAFQTRSQVDILDDGYRWRKYGQKAVKNNKFPRSYYRCTHQGCNVKKQVQRLSNDDGVVVTTYDGVHSHPIEKPSDNFEHILSQMQIYTAF